MEQSFLLGWGGITVWFHQSDRLQTLVTAVYHKFNSDPGSSLLTKSYKKHSTWQWCKHTKIQANVYNNTDMGQPTQLKYTPLTAILNASITNHGNND